MTPARFELPVPTDARRRLAAGWLGLGVGALLASGLLSILLVLARTPRIGAVFPWTDFFHTALVVHVDLSVLVWFLAFGGVLWSLNSTARALAAGWVALGLAALGAALMALAPFTGAGSPLMSNYVPMLQTPLFIAALLVFTAGVTLLVLRSMTAIPPVGLWLEGGGALRFGLNAAAVATAIALLAFGWTWLTLPEFVQGKGYYELLFWGGGHVLQFTWTLLMLVCWLWLASASGVDVPLSGRVALILFAFGLLAVFLAPLIYYAHEVASPRHLELFTWLMRYGGSLAALPLSVAVLAGLYRSPPARDDGRPLRAALLCSIALFGLGGLIGFLIQGSNVVVPAHYHGSIVGVTLAFMGMTYLLLPRLGAGAPPARAARLQPWVYAGGQLTHVLGLWWSGGYGVQRKVAGAEQALSGVKQIAAMGLMGLGGLVAVAGGLMFLYVVYRAVRDRPRGHQASGTSN